MLNETMKLPQRINQDNNLPQVIGEDKEIQDLVMPPSEHILESFTEPKTVKDYNPLELDLLAEKYRRIIPTDIFPSKYSLGHVQKAYIIPSSYESTDGPNGDKKRYLSFLALTIDISYLEKDLKGLQSYIMFPIVALGNMTERSLNLWFDGFIRRYDDAVIEIHFVKRNIRHYDLLFLSVVEHIEAKTFRRTRIDYRHPKYNEETGKLKR